MPSYVILTPERPFAHNASVVVNPLARFDPDILPFFYDTCLYRWRLLRQPYRAKVLSNWTEKKLLDLIECCTAGAT